MKNNKNFEFYYCIKCKINKICKANFLYGSRKCKSCSNLGRIYSAETRLKISKINKDKILSKKTKKRISMSAMGRQFSLSTRKKISKANMGRKLSEETKAKLRKATHTHHIDLNPKNNIKNNLLRINNCKHRSLHHKAYNYLLEKFGIKEVEKYTKWFIKKYGK